MINKEDLNTFESPVWNLVTDTGVVIGRRRINGKEQFLVKNNSGDCNIVNSFEGKFRCPDANWDTNSPIKIHRQVSASVDNSEHRDIEDRLKRLEDKIDSINLKN